MGGGWTGPLLAGGWSGAVGPEERASVEQGVIFPPGVNSAYYQGVWLRLW